MNERAGPLPSSVKTSETVDLKKLDYISKWKIKQEIYVSETGDGRLQCYITGLIKISSLQFTCA